MTKQQKYPETRTFHYHNQNPRNRITTDCVIRAISTATEIPYNQVIMEMAEMQCKTGYDRTSSQGINYYLKEKGWVKHSQPRKADGTKYTGKEWCEVLNHSIWFLGKSIIANIGSHHIVCIKEVSGLHGTFKVHDIFDSTDGCIGNFWIKS